MEDHAFGSNSAGNHFVWFRDRELQKDAKRFADDWITRWAGLQWENTYLLTLPPEQRPFGEVLTNEFVTTPFFVRPSHSVVGGVATFFLPEVTASDPPQSGDDRRKAKLLTTYRNAALLGGSLVVSTLNQQLPFAELQSRGFFHLTPDKEQGSPLHFLEICAMQQFFDPRNSG